MLRVKWQIENGFGIVCVDLTARRGPIDIFSSAAHMKSQKELDAEAHSTSVSG